MTNQITTDECDQCGIDVAYDAICACDECGVYHCIDCTCKCNQTHPSDITFEFEVNDER